MGASGVGAWVAGALGGAVAPVTDARIRCFSANQVGHLGSSMAWGPLHAGQQGTAMQSPRLWLLLPHRPQRAGREQIRSLCLKEWHLLQRVVPGM